MVDNHHAAKAGVKSENSVKNAISECGLTLLKTQKEYNKYYVELDTASKEWQKCQYLCIPEDQKDLDNAVNKNGEYVHYTPDGYIPLLDCRVEVKYSEKKGTTESKVFDDLEKIRDGVYSDKKLLYIFIGPLAKSTFKFSNFARKVKQFDPTEEKVKVLFDDTPDLSILKAYLTSEYDLWRQRNGG